MIGLAGAWVSCGLGTLAGCATTPAAIPADAQNNAGGASAAAPDTQPRRFTEPAQRPGDGNRHRFDLIVEHFAERVRPFVDPTRADRLHGAVTYFRMGIDQQGHKRLARGPAADVGEHVPRLEPDFGVAGHSQYADRSLGFD